MPSRDHFIHTNGRSVTLRKETTLAYNEYDEIDEASSTYTDTSIKVVLGPITKDVVKRMPAGLEWDQDDLAITFQGSANIAAGDLIIDGTDYYRVIALWNRTYAGSTIMKGLLRRERQ